MYIHITQKELNDKHLAAYWMDVWVMNACMDICMKSNDRKLMKKNWKKNVL